MAEDGSQPSKRSKVIDELEEHGAGDGNRTRMTSLEGWGSAIELRPHELPMPTGRFRAQAHQAGRHP